MNIGNIIKDSLGYPLSDKKNFLILAVLILLAELYAIILSLGVKSSVLMLLLVLTFLLMFIRGGYVLKILNSSINGHNALPDFGNWLQLFKDGIKLVIVGIIYFIPLVIILFVSILILGMVFISSGGLNGFNDSVMFIVVFAIFGIYILVIYPLILMAIANMARHENNLSYALKFGEIRTKISDIGLGNYVKWYIVTGIIYIVLLGIGMGLSTVFGLVHAKFIGLIINALTFGPFAVIFLYRSTSLMYRSVLELEAESVEDPELTL